MARRSNAATAKDLVRTFRGNIGSLESADTMLSLDGFVSKHEILLKEILEQTLRPTSTLLREAVSLVWPSLPPLDVKSFCNHMHEVFKVLFTKSRNMTTGDRYPDSVGRMCAIIRSKTCSDQRQPVPKAQGRGRRASTCSTRSAGSTDQDSFVSTPILDSKKSNSR